MELRRDRGQGATVELAIEAAMGELGVDDREQLAVEIIQEPEKGFLGFGGQDAVVRVKEGGHAVGATKSGVARGTTVATIVPSSPGPTPAGDGRNGLNRLRMRETDRVRARAGVET